MMPAVCLTLADAALFAALISSATALGSFRDPINPGSDPFMTYHNWQYHLTSTQGDSIKMWSSPSLSTILQADPITVWQDSHPSRNKNMWAPEFYRLDGFWYLYYTADDGVDSNHRVYVLESDYDDPRGPYHFKGQLSPPNHANNFSIDPSVMKHNGRLYLSYSGTTNYNGIGLVLVPLKNPYTIGGDAVAIDAPGGCPEVRQAAQFHSRNDRTWMTYSTCDTGKPDYQIWLMSVGADADPLVPKNWVQHAGPIFSRPNHRTAFGTGHHGLFTSPDGTEDWMVYHAKTTDKFTYSDRTTRAKKITWNKDGTPNFGSPAPLGATMDLPSGDPGSGNYWINNDGRSSGNGTVNFTGSWAYGNQCDQCFWNDDSWDDQWGHTATFTFTGDRIALFNAKDTNYGIAAISIDDGPEQKVDYYSSIRIAQALQYMSPHLPFGRHTLRIRVTGERNPSSAGAFLNVDRAEVYTDGSGRYYG